MNSLSQCNNNKKSSLYNKHDDCGKDCTHPVPGKAILTCSTGNFSTNINIVFPSTLQVFNQPIASVTIDTACLKCPSILIDFAGILTSTPTQPFNLLSITATFTLFKICKESKIRQPIDTYNFNILNITQFPDSQTIKFEYAPCDDQCEDCCTYILELTRVTTAFGNSTGTISLTGTLCVIAVNSL